MIIRKLDPNYYLTALFMVVYICIIALGNSILGNLILEKMTTMWIQIFRERIINDIISVARKIKTLLKIEKKRQIARDEFSQIDSYRIYVFAYWFCYCFRLTSSHLAPRFIWRSNNSPSPCSCSPIRGLTMQKCCRANCMLQRHLVTTFPTWVGFAICVFPNDYR